MQIKHADHLGIFQLIAPNPAQEIVPWIQEHIKIEKSDDTIGDMDLSLTPYLNPIYESWTDKKVNKITVVGVEKLGKTCAWIYPLLYRLYYDNAKVLIVYENEDKAARINQDDIEPLLKRIPKLETAFNKPWATNANSYHLDNSSVYFLGSGSPITSYKANIVIADEVDKWKLPNMSATKASDSTNVSNLKNLDKRIRNKAQALRVAVCSPTVQSGEIWQQFLKSNQSYWHLKCLACSSYFPSHSLNNLQFETDENNRLIEESIRLVCPDCGHEFAEDEHYELTRNGKYISKNVHETSHVGYQFGALAAPAKKLGWQLLTWKYIAEAILESGKTASRENHLELDNSWRGLPFQYRKLTEKEENLLEKHKLTYPKDLEIAYQLLSADTQDDSHYWVIRGWDKLDNSYLIDYGISQSVDDLRKQIQRVPFAILDIAGNRSQEMVHLLDECHNLYGYRGVVSKTQSDRWKQGSEHAKSIYAKARLFQSDLLYKMYSQLDMGKPFWYLPDNVNKEYLDSILDVQMNNKMKYGHEYENWQSKNGVDHFFDCEKMCLVLNEIFSKKLLSGFVAKQTDASTVKKEKPKVRPKSNWLKI